MGKWKWLGFGLLVIALGLLLMPSVLMLIEASCRAHSYDNLKRLAVAMHAHQNNGQLLPHAIYSKDGRPLLSWRVAILPSLDRTDLFQKFHLNEPWDSPHNITLLHQMPEVYTLPYGSHKAYHTVYQVIVGPGAAFEGTKGRDFQKDFTNPGRTVLIIEAKHAVPWTKPEDLVYDPEKPLPQVGGYKPNTAGMALVDGSVRSLSPDSIQQELPRFILGAPEDEDDPPVKP